MATIQNNSTDSMSKCSDTTDESTLSTLEESQQLNPLDDLPTEQKQPEPCEKQQSDVSLVSIEVYKEFLLTDLKSWILQVDGHEYTARHCPTEVWVRYFSEYADLEVGTDWTDLEQRA